MSDWTFFSNHAHVLFVLSHREQITMRELAVEVGITERFAHKIIRDLEEQGFIDVEKEGRANRYKVNRKKKLRHPVEAHVKVGSLITFVLDNAPRSRV